MTQVRTRIAFYCPDSNLKLAGDIPWKKGLGGGKTALIKMADALNRAGHSVKVFAYCIEGTYNNVEYLDFNNIKNISCDILIAITGGRGNLSDLYNRNVHAKIKILWLSGAGFISGIDNTFFDYYYANSEFLKKRAIQEWKFPFEKVLATHQGYDPEDFLGIQTDSIERNPYAIVFASHPSKGLNRIIEIIEQLRKDVSNKLNLDIYGGFKLWDDNDTREVSTQKDFISYKGFLSQPELCKKLFNYNFMLHLTDYEDTSSILIQQAKKSGVIVIASDVGGNCELVENGYDGFIIKDNYGSLKCYTKVKNLIAYLLNHMNYISYIRENAQKHSLSWDEIAIEWATHWSEILNKN
jgi:glycosyltransferase involved in cell wall biosynthesis